MFIGLSRIDIKYDSYCLYLTEFIAIVCRNYNNDYIEHGDESFDFLPTEIRVLE